MCRGMERQQQNGCNFQRFVTFDLPKQNFDMRSEREFISRDLGKPCNKFQTDTSLESEKKTLAKICDKNGNLTKAGRRTNFGLTCLSSDWSSQRLLPTSQRNTQHADSVT